MRNYIPTYLDREVYKRVLSVAASYDCDVRSIKAIEYDKINSSPAHESEIRGSGVSNPVQSMVEQIDKRCKLLREHTRAVECSLHKFSIDEQSVIEQNVLSGIPMINCNTQKSERTCKSIRHNFLIVLAKELGEIL